MNNKGRLAQIFELQQELMHRYHPIERGNGFWTPDAPIEIDSPKGQLRLKEFAWRFTEEMAESSGALHLFGPDSSIYHEELVDALHFFVEFCIYAAIGPDRLVNLQKKLPFIAHDDLDSIYRDAFLDQGSSIEDQSFFTTKSRGTVTKDFLDLMMWKCVSEMGKACNRLKNRPWKKSHVNTDRDAFESDVSSCFRLFIQVCGLSGMSPDHLFEGYVGKHRVNRQRQEGSY